MNKVSVITVVYNGAKCISRTLDSVKSQTYKQIEYIVVDGKSNDGTLNILAKYNSIIAKQISESDQGVYDAMNKGIRMCEGDWVVFMNAGDTFASEKTLSEIFDNNRDLTKADVIYGDTINCNGENYFQIKAKPLNELRYRMAFCHQSSYVRASVLKQNEFNLNYKLAADYDLFHRLYIDGAAFLYIPHFFSVYYLEGGLTDSNGAILFREIYKISGMRDLKMFFISLRSYISRLIHKVIPFSFINFTRKIVFHNTKIQ